MSGKQEGPKGSISRWLTCRGPVPLGLAGAKVACEGVAAGGAGETGKPPGPGRSLRFI